MRKKTILLVEDDQSLQFTLRCLIEDMGYEIVVATDHEQAVAALRGGPYAAAIVDYLIDNVPSSKFIAELQRLHPQTPLVCSTAAFAHQIQLEEGSVPNAYLFKPFGTTELRNTLQALIRN